MSFNNDILSDDETELFEILDRITQDSEKNNINEQIIYKNPNQTDTEEKGFCKHCNTADKIAEDTSQGIIVCIGCGSIISEIFDENPEWKQYPGEDDNHKSVARCSQPTNFFLPQSSLGTTIAGSNRNKLKVLNGWNAMPYKERSLNLILKEIQNRCRDGGILKCIEDDAKIFYKIISESKHRSGKNIGKTVIIRGSNRRSLVAACVFYACKKNKITRSPKEIADLFKLKYKDVTKGCKIFVKFIKLQKTPYDIQISNPEHFIKRYCRKLHITNEYIDQAIVVAKNIQKLDIASMHTPESVATGSILLIIDINNLNIERKQISTQFAVSEVTIAKTFKKLGQYKNILVNDELTDKLVQILMEDQKKIKMPNKLKLMYDEITKNDDTTNDNKDKSECIGEDSEHSEYSEDLEDDFNDNIKIIFDRKFDDSIENLDEYFDNINIELYDLLNVSEERYNILMTETI